MYPDHKVDFSHVFFVFVSVGHVLADVKRVPQPTEPKVSAERAPPQHALQVPAQIEMVKAAHAAHQPQQVRERLAFVAALGAAAAAAAATAVASVDDGSSAHVLTPDKQLLR